MNRSNTPSAPLWRGLLHNLWSAKSAMLFQGVLLGAALAIASGLNRAVVGQEVPELPGPALAPAGAEEEGIETLTHGPIHEAFAAPTGTDPEPGPIVAKQPPPNVEEEPPALKAEGAIWIPGYWEFDDEMKDFIWISGNWRVPPPGMRWVPSYWVEAEGGWQRVPGFWVSADAGELEYRETPPETLEAGPSGPAPADDHFWIPGTWNYYETGYRWRPGYWSPYQTNWIWTPARWVWTPAGCVYVAGYWDHRLAYRGHLFAPVYFRTAYYAQPGYRYRPWCTVPVNNLFVHLWIRPNYNCYYFGDYYGPRYTNWVPWYRWGWGRHRHHYDPILTWCRVHYRRQGIDYVDRMDRWHRHFNEHEDLRPPRNWRQQVDLMARADVNVRTSQRVLAADLRDLARRDDLPVRLTRIDDREREALSRVTDELRDLRSQRHKLEADVKAHVAARLPVDGDAARPGRSPAEARIDAQARAREAVKLRLPKMDADVRATLDAALSGRAGGRGRDVPAAADPGPAGERTGRLDVPGVGERPGTDRPGTDRPGVGRPGVGRPDVGRPEVDLPGVDRPGRDRPGAGRPDVGRPEVDLPEVDRPGRDRPGADRPGADRPGADRPGIDLPGADRPRGDRPSADRPGTDLPGVERPGRSAQERADEVLRDLRSRGIPGLPADRAAPRTTVPDRTPSIETPKTPRIDIPDRTPRSDGRGREQYQSPPYIPDSRFPRTETPRIDIPDRTPRSTTPRLDIPDRTPRIDVPDRTPRTVAPRPTPRVDIPRPAPRVDIPRVTPRPATPRVDTSPRINTTPRSVPRIDIPRAAPRPEASRPAPRINTTAPRVNIPRVDVPRSAPRIDIPRSAPRVNIPRSTPSIDRGSSSAPRVNIPRSSASRGGGKGRDRD